MRQQTDLSQYRSRNDSLGSVENLDHIKIILPQDIDELFYFISTPIWNQYDQNQLEILDQDDFYMTLTDVMAKLSEKYQLNED